MQHTIMLFLVLRIRRRYNILRLMLDVLLLSNLLRLYTSCCYIWWFKSSCWCLSSNFFIITSSSWSRSLSCDVFYLHSRLLERAGRIQQAFVLLRRLQLYLLLRHYKWCFSICSDKYYFYYRWSNIFRWS